MNYGEILRYSIDELLKIKPKQIEGLKRQNNGENNYFFKVNGIKIFATRYEIIYEESFCALRFYDNFNNIVATISEFGSNKFKGDSAFIVGYDGIISESLFEILKSQLKRLKSKCDIFESEG